jgi:anaerobic selenocysteine-containing dehydrogenase
VLIVCNNPVTVAPIEKWLCLRLFTVVLEHSSQAADYAATCCRPRRNSSMSAHHVAGHLYVREYAAIEPLGEALPNSEIFRRLAAKIGDRASETDDEQRRRSSARVQPWTDWQRLKQSGAATRSPRHAPFARGAFATVRQCEFSRASAKARRIRCLRTSAMQAAGGGQWRDAIARSSPPAPGT